MSNLSGIQIAQALGITVSAFAAGGIFTLSYSAIPRLLESPTPIMLSQWDTLYEQGKRTFPTISAISVIANAWLAYEFHTQSSYKWMGYTVAAVLTAGIAPYTLTLMLPTNNAIKAKKAQVKTLNSVDAGLPENETSGALVKKWAVLNFGRALLPLAGAIVAAYTTLTGN